MNQENKLTNNRYLPLRIIPASFANGHQDTDLQGQNQTKLSKKSRQNYEAHDSVKQVDELEKLRAYNNELERQKLQLQFNVRNLTEHIGSLLKIVGQHRCSASGNLLEGNQKLLKLKVQQMRQQHVSVKKNTHSLIQLNKQIENIVSVYLAENPTMLKQILQEQKSPQIQEAGPINSMTMIREILPKLRL